MKGNIKFQIEYSSGGGGGDVSLPIQIQTCEFFSLKIPALDTVLTFYHVHVFRAPPPPNCHNRYSRSTVVFQWEIHLGPLSLTLQIKWTQALKASWQANKSRGGLFFHIKGENLSAEFSWTLCLMGDWKTLRCRTQPMMHLHDDSHSVLVGKLELEIDADYELLNHSINRIFFNDTYSIISSSLK